MTDRTRETSPTPFGETKSLREKSIKQIPRAARLLKREQLGKEIKYFQTGRLWNGGSLLRRLRERRKLSPRIRRLRRPRFFNYQKEGSSAFFGLQNENSLQVRSVGLI